MSQPVQKSQILERWKVQTEQKTMVFLSMGSVIARRALSHACTRHKRTASVWRSVTGWHNQRQRLLTQLLCAGVWMYISVFVCFAKRVKYCGGKKAFCFCCVRRNMKFFFCLACRKTLFKFCFGRRLRSSEEDALSYIVIGNVNTELNRVFQLLLFPSECLSYAMHSWSCPLCCFIL